MPTARALIDDRESDQSQHRKQLRMSNIELLRIVSMMFIVSFHCVYKSGWNPVNTPYANRVILDCFTMLGEIGVNLFVLITGCFMAGKRFTWKKLMLLVLEVWFYNALSVVLLRTLDKGAIPSLRQALLFPVIDDRYWFITSYLLLYLFSPFLHKLLRSLTRREHIKLILILVVIWSVVPTLLGGPYYKYGAENGMLYYNRMLWMVAVYTIGDYLSNGYRENQPSWMIQRHFLAAGICLLGLLTFILLAEHVPGKFEMLGLPPTYFWPPNSIPSILIAVELFLGFVSLRIPPLKVINTIASTTLGVYLLHDGLLTQSIWTCVNLASHTSAYPWKVCAYVILCSACIFAVGVIVDLVREQIMRHLPFVGILYKRYARANFVLGEYPCMQLHALNTSVQS